MSFRETWRWRRLATVRLTYDGEADAAFLYLTGSDPTKGVARTEMCDLEIDEGAVILLFTSRSLA